MWATDPADLDQSMIMSAKPTTSSVPRILLYYGGNYKESPLHLVLGGELPHFPFSYSHVSWKWKIIPPLMSHDVRTCFVSEKDAPSSRTSLLLLLC